MWNRYSSDFQRVYSFCDGKGNNEDEYYTFLTNLSAEYSRPLSIAIFAGWIAEFAAGVAVILLYVAVGSLSLSILVSARKTLQASRIKLQQLQRSVLSDRDLQAATAGARCARATARVCAPSYVACSFGRSAGHCIHYKRQDAAARRLLLSRPPLLHLSCSIFGFDDICKFKCRWGQFA